MACEAEAEAVQTTLAVVVQWQGIHINAIQNQATAEANTAAAAAGLASAISAWNAAQVALDACVQGGG